MRLAPPLMLEGMQTPLLPEGLVVVGQRLRSPLVETRVLARRQTLRRWRTRSSWPPGGITRQLFSSSL